MEGRVSTGTIVSIPRVEGFCHFGYKWASFVESGHWVPKGVSQG